QWAGQSVFTLMLLAERRMQVSDFKGAAAYYGQALELAAAHFGEGHTRTASVHSDLAFALRELGRFEEAERHARAALPVLLAARGDTSLVVNQTRRTLASALRMQGRYDEAEGLLRAVLASAPQSPDRAVTLGALATLLREQEDLAGAAEAQREVVALLRRRFGAAHPMLAYSLTKLADIQTEQARYAEAEQILLGGLAAWPEESGPGRQLRRSLVALYEAWERPDRAEAYRGGPARDTASA